MARDSSGLGKSQLALRPNGQAPEAGLSIGVSSPISLADASDYPASGNQSNRTSATVSSERGLQCAEGHERGVGRLLR
jgi:hypothetical protein